MLLKNVRLSFPNIFVANAFQAGQEPKFGAMFVMDPKHPQLEELKESIVSIGTAKWGKKIPAAVVLCLRNNEEKAHLDGFESGGMFFNATNKKRPLVLDKGRNPTTEADGLIYAGCYVNVMVDFWAQDNNYGKRINASLAGVQFSDDGDAFGGGANASVDDFPELEQDPTSRPKEFSDTAESASKDTGKSAGSADVASQMFG